MLRDIVLAQQGYYEVWGKQSTTQAWMAAAFGSQAMAGKLTPYDHLFLEAPSIEEIRRAKEREREGHDKILKAERKKQYYKELNDI